MKILFDASNLFSANGGGVYNYLLKFLPELIQQAEINNDQLKFFHLYFRANEKFSHPALLKSEILRLRFPVKLINSLWISFNLPDLSLFYKNFDIFHSPHFSLPAFSSAKKILTVNDITYLKHPEFFSSKGKKLNDYGYKKLLSANVLRADKIIAISQYTKNDLIDYFGLPESKISVVYIGCDSTLKMDALNLQKSLDAFNISDGQYIYFPVGTLEPRKNINSTIKAFLNSNASLKLKLVLSGVGSYDFVDNIHSNHNVKIVRWNSLQERNALYQGAAFVLYPSLYEGFGMPVVEAMAAAKAVLTSNTTSLAEIADGYAHMVDPLNIDEITDGINQLFSDHSYRHDLEVLSIRRSNDFTWRKMAADTYKIYKHLYN